MLEYTGKTEFIQFPKFKKMALNFLHHFSCERRNFMEILQRIDISEKFASMWRKSREDAGKSQDFMAKAMRVSKRTIQNWEAGISCPSQSAGLEWFQILGLAPLPYYLELLYPEHTKNLMENIRKIQK